jgi:hypothetical protein
MRPMMKQEPQEQSPYPVNQVVPVSIDLDEDDEDDEDEEEQELAEQGMEEGSGGNFVSGTYDTGNSQPSPAGLLARSTTSGVQQGLNKPVQCRFGAHCTNTNCRFSHQSQQPCRSFPNCPFADKCNYKHPTCKFDDGCTRPNCPYHHTIAKQPPQGTYVRRGRGSDEGVPAPQSTGSFSFPPLPVPCKFGAACWNYDSCPFKHPKTCKFGVGCMSHACTFSHPGGGLPPAANKPNGKRAIDAPPKMKLVNNPQPLVDTARFKWKAPEASEASGGVAVALQNQGDTSP